MDKKYIIVEYDRKDLAKQYGAKWDKIKKLWYITNEINTEILDHFQLFDERIYLHVNYEDKNKVKNLNGSWDSDKKLWYVSKFNTKALENFPKYDHQNDKQLYI